MSDGSNNVNATVANPNIILMSNPNANANTAAMMAMPGDG